MFDMRVATDEFLINVNKILNLDPNFKYTHETQMTVLDISNDQKKKLKKICEDNKYRRNIYNTLFYPSECNVNWSYDVLKLYFLLDFDNKK